MNSLNLFEEPQCPRLPEPFFVTQLPKGGGWLPPPPCDFEIYAHKVLLFTTIV